MNFNFPDSYTKRLAEIESSMNPWAQNPNSSAKGLYQFTDETAKQYGITDPYDPVQTTQAVQRLADDNRKVMAQALGRDPTDAELYLAHQQGATGATKLLQNPTANAADLVGPEALANNGGTPDMTAQDFANKWINKFSGDQKQQQMQDASAQSASADGAMSTAPAPAADNLIDVKLPDGTIVQGVPADITKADLMAKLKNNGLDVPTDETAKEPVKKADEKTKYSPTAESIAKVTNGLTYGLGDEATSALGAVGAKLFGSDATKDISVPDLYSQGLKNTRSKAAAFSENNPIVAPGLEIGGALISGGALGKLAQKVAPETMSALSRYATTDPIKAAATIGAGSGGVYGFNTGEGDLTDRIDNAVTGGALGAVGGAVGGAVANKLSSKFGNKSALASLTDDATVKGTTPENTAIANDLQNFSDKLTGNAVSKDVKSSALARLTDEQAQRAQVLKQAGVDNPTAAMISRDPKTWQFEQNTKGINGVGEDIQQRYATANESIQNALNEVGIKTGGKATSPYEAGESVVDAVTKKSREMQDEVGKLYGKIREDVGDNYGMQPNKLKEAITDFSDEAAADPVVSSVMRRLTKYGVADKEGNFIASASGKSEKALSVNQSEELRKFINRLSDGNDPSVKRIKGGLIDALDDDVIDGAGVDSFKSARDAARARFAEFNSKAITGKIGEGKLVSDDVLKKTLFGGKVKDLQAFRDTLTSGTPEQVDRGTQALKDLQLQGLQEIIDRSSDAGGKISGAAFSKQLKNIGKERLETLYDPETVMKLKTIEKALEYTTIPVPESVVNYSGTAAASANNFLAGILKTSKIGEALEKGAEKVSQIPVVGTIVSPAAKIIKGGGQIMQEAAQKQSVKNVVNPGSALSKLADSEAVTGGAISGGVGSGVLFNKPLKITVKASDENFEGTDANKKREAKKKK